MTARQLIDDTGWVEPDLAASAERLGLLALQAGRPAIAGVALQLARDQFAGLGREEDEARVMDLQTR